MERNSVILELKNISKSYVSKDVTVHALNKVSIQIKKGELVAILGASGSGKSTLLNIMGSLDTPTEGELFYKGKKHDFQDKKKSTAYRCNEIGFVFQSYNLLPNLSTRDNILAAGEIVKNPMPWEEALKSVGLTEKAHSLPSSLSGGEQQRVAIARALTKNAPVILADEPTGALDSTNGLLIMDIFKKLTKDNEKTVIMVTHNEELANMADRIIHMKDGKSSGRRK